MKIQGLAIIFIIIILPISIIIGEYANTQIHIFKMEQLYNSRLITATHDGLKAFQINTFNDATSDIADSKINTIEASVNAFYNSMESSFGLEGYSKEDLQRYIPALVYTMYDGYYIYSPYTNVADISKGEGLEINLDSNKIEHGFKPYVYYSCRYIKGNIDVVINYSLDNYITVQGTIDGNPVYKSGYLLTLASSKSDEGVYKETLSDGTEKYYYSGIEIIQETNLKDFLIERDSTGDTIKRQYKYIKLNGTKYYLNEKDDDGDGTVDEYIFYLMGGDRIKQVTSANEELYKKYKDQIQKNTSGINYYKNAYEFTKWVNEKLGNLTPSDAQVKTGEQGERVKKSSISPIFNNKQIEYPGSNFNLHRKEVIRYSIESNLSVAIANFNSYTDVGANFQMPKLKETEWEMLQNEVSIISFLQGMNLGGKIYNGYTVVTNNKTEEVVKEERIYITADENGDLKEDYYHKVNDKHFVNEFVAHLADDDIMSGVLDLDFEIRKDGAIGYSYVQKDELGCYTSIVSQENVDNRYDSIYEYLNKLDNSEAVLKKLKQIYYTALGRERWGTYKTQNPSIITSILNNMSPGEPIEETPEPEKPPIITINTSCEPNAYISNIQKPTIKGNITITSEVHISEARYILTNSDMVPESTEEWKLIPISSDGKTGVVNDIIVPELTAGTWYLHVYASNGKQITKTREFNIYKDNNPPTLKITDIDSTTDTSNYEIRRDYSNVIIGKQIIVKDEGSDEGDVSSGIKTGSYEFKDPDGNICKSGNILPGILEPLKLEISADKEGTYTLNVQVQDNAGNTATITRNYNVSKQVETEATYTIKITDLNSKKDTVSYKSTTTSLYSFKKQISVSSSTGVMPEGYTIRYAFANEGASPMFWSIYSPTSGISSVANATNGTIRKVLYVKVISQSGEELATAQRTYTFYRRADAIITDPIRPGLNEVIM